MRSVSVFAPATVANVGSAFDVLGFAIEKPGDTVTARRSATLGVTIKEVSGDNGRLPIDPKANTAGVATSALLAALTERDGSTYSSVGIELTIEKGLPIGSGLGSSSASAVAAVVAAHELLGAPLPKTELLPFAMEGERIACGAAHADNVAPALLGGFVLIRSYSPLDIIQLPAPPRVWVSVVTPDLELKTQDARKVLKKTVALESAISQWGNVAALVAGIYTDDVALMGRALEDKVVEPERAQLIPGYAAAKASALKLGATGCSISGSGPSVFALANSEASATAIAEGMCLAFNSIGVTATPHISRVNGTGAKVVHKE